MRRKDKEITAIAEIEAIIREADLMVLCLVDEGTPYMVPLNYGFDGKSLFFHSAKSGRKVGLIGSGTQVSGLIVSGNEVVCKGTTACTLSTRYKSVMFEGRVHRLEADEEKNMAMQTILGHLWNHELPLPANALQTVYLYRVDLSAITAKRSPAEEV